MTEALATVPAAGEYRSLSTRTDEELRTYQRQAGCVNCTGDEWRMLGILSDMYKLDPFAKQIWLIPGVGVMVGHAGFLQIAHRSGRFGGMSTETYNRDGSIYTGEGLPAYSICTVWYTDSPHPVTKKVIFTDFFKPGQNGKKTNWDKMPGFMIEKVAEVHALKRAFSIGGIYCPEEFGYDEEEVTPKAEFTATVDGEPVKVEPIKQDRKPAAKQEPKPEKCTCGAEPMDSYERNKMQAAFDEQGLGTIPANMCKTCATKHWRLLRDQQQRTP